MKNMIKLKRGDFFEYHDPENIIRVRGAKSPEKCVVDFKNPITEWNAEKKENEFSFSQVFNETVESIVSMVGKS